jgi:hypothetical protein
MGSVLELIVLTLLSGVGDALGFIHAARVWRSGAFVWPEAAKSGTSFLFGVAMYWLALRRLADWGVVSAEAQTLVWFAATIVGVAALSGRMVRWPALDQGVAALVLVGIAWLLFRTAE